MRTPFRTSFAIFIASLGALTSGMFFTNFNSSMPKVLGALGSDLQVSKLTLSLLTGSIPAGAIFGAFLANFLINPFGRRKTMMFADILGIPGGILSVIPNTIVMLMGLFLCGIAVGINFVTVPIFIKEISRYNSGNTSTRHFRSMFSLGAFLPFALVALLKDVRIVRWRLLYVFPLIFSAVRLALLLCFARTETPAYYLKHKQEDKALLACKRYYHMSDLDLAYHHERKIQRHNKTFSIFDFQYKRQTRTALLYTLAGQLMGANAIYFISTRLFAGVGGRNLNSLAHREGDNMILGLIMLAVTGFTATAESKVKRRPLIVYGTILMSLSALFMIFVETFRLEVGEKVLILGYGMLAALVPGLMMRLQMEEMLPIISLKILTILEFAITLGMTTLTSFLGPRMTFLTFGFFGIIAGFIMGKTVKETKGASHTDILKLFNNSKAMGLLDEEIQHESQYNMITPGEYDQPGLVEKMTSPATKPVPERMTGIEIR